jgi:hypothetical protein
MGKKAEGFSGFKEGRHISTHPPGSQGWRFARRAGSEHRGGTGARLAS